MYQRLGRLTAVAAVVVIAALVITSLALAFSANFDDLPDQEPIDGLTVPGMTFYANENSMLTTVRDSLPPEIELQYVSGKTIGFIITEEENAWLEIELDEPQDVVSFDYLYAELMPVATVTAASVLESSAGMLIGELDGEVVVNEPIPTGELVGIVDDSVLLYEGQLTLNERVDRIRLTTPTGLYLDNIETSLLPEPDDSAPMSCTTGDRSLNARHCGRPVAIFARSGGFSIYGVDINTGWGSLASTITAEQIEAVGVPADGPVVIAEGQNPYNFQPFTLYRLSSGEYQLNTFYWDGKPYAVKWEGTRPVQVVTW